MDELAATLGGALPARSAARDLVAAIVGQPRFWPTAHRAEPVDEQVARRARTAATRIVDGMPFAYAVGSAAFRTLTLSVDRRVLIPRPETELIVDLALAATGGRGTIADVGTGSGAIALSLAAEGSFDRVIATDLSPDALDVARSNVGAIPAEKRSQVEFRLGDLTVPLAGDQFAALVSNPPYIADPERAELPPAVRDWEPASALFAGEDGMDAIARLVAGAADVVAPGGALLVEIDSRRGAAALRCAETDGRWSDVQIRPDLTGRDRFLTCRRTSR